MDHGAILGDDAVKQVEASADMAKIWDLAPGDENELSTGLLQPLESADRLVVHNAMVARERILNRVGRFDLMADA